MGRFRGAVFQHGGVPENSPLSLMGRFPSLMGRFVLFNFQGRANHEVHIVNWNTGILGVESA